MKNNKKAQEKPKNKLVLGVIILIPLIVLGIMIYSSSNSGSKSNALGSEKNTVTQLRFKDLISISELKKIDGKQVSIVGFMAPVSPLDGSFAYVLNMPFQSCPFCIPNTSELANTIAIYPKSGSTIPYTDAPIVATGKLVFGDFVDEYNYTYQYRIEDVKIDMADESLLDDNVNIYGTIAKEGVFDDLNGVFYELEEPIRYVDYQIKPEELKKVNIEAIDKIISTLKAHNSSEYDGIISSVEQLKDIGEQVNSYLDKSQYDKLADLIEDFNKAYDDFYAWVTQFEV